MKDFAEFLALAVVIVVLALWWYSRHTGGFDA